MSTEMVKCKVNGKYDIILPKHRAERPEWYTEQGWERKRLDHIHKTIKKDDVVAYIGAEEGDMCALLALWGAKLIMFEPNELVLPNIKAIWEANSLSMDDTIYTGFVGNKTTGTTIHKIGHITGKVIHDHGFKELKDPGDIPIVKLDDTGLKIDIISIDVEGSEFEVLRGAEQTLRKQKPKIYLSLHPEFLHEQYGDWGAELRKWLIDIGYTETLIDYPMHEVHLYYE